MHFSADILTDIPLPHYGILDADSFDEHYDLRCYAPPDDLAPYVVHLWTQRPRIDQPPIPLEVQTGPNTYIFINHDEAYIHGIFSDQFRYQPHAYPVYAGVKFRPGGLRAFADIAMSELCERTMLASALFPGINDLTRTVDTTPDGEIITSLIGLLRKQRRHVSSEFTLVSTAMQLIDSSVAVPQLDELQRGLSMSDRSMRRLFETHVGVPAKWVLMRKRFIETTHTATTAPLSWGAAAAQYGYSSQSHFTREFRRITHISPSALQQNLAHSHEIASITSI